MARVTKVHGFLETLRRIPDDIVLSMMTLDLVLEEPSRCLCGWAVRESIARATNREASFVATEFVPEQVVREFGGTYDEWDAIYYGVCGKNAPYIERALALRIEEAVNA